MPSATRFLQSEYPAGDPAVNITVDSDVVVVLASLLCALICVVGLALVARCAWLRRADASSAADSHRPSLPTTSNRGIKKKVLNSLPKVSFDAGEASKQTTMECAICLSEFEDGELIRVLPQCGHGFHVDCIDTWLGSHSSCPSCRQVLVVPAPSSTCQKCGASSAAAASSGDSRFLP